MRFWIIPMLFVVVESFGQKDSLSEEQVYRLLKEKGWSLSSSGTPGDIQLDDNRVELFPDFYFNSFAKSIEFKKSRIKYPLTYLAFNQNEVIDNWDKIQKDSLIDLGKQFVFIPAGSSRIILWTVDGKTIQNIFTTEDKRWYLTKIIVTKE